MSEINLKPNDTKILAEAGSQDGRITFPERMKESTRQRLAGVFARHGLAEPAGDEGELRLSAMGYRAVGLEPPRVKTATLPRGAKRDLVHALLGRGEGASLDELVAATGWLPHTTRAVLSRLRSGGTELVKSKRPDGTTSYRIGGDVEAMEPALEVAA